MNAAIDLRASDRDIVENILRKVLPKSAKIWIFGSRAKGQARRASDLDLAIELGRVLTRTESSQLFNAFEASALPFKVDVVDLCNIKPPFKNIIEKEKKLFMVL